MEIAGRRVRLPEVMDDPQLDAARHRHALRGLARINMLSTSAAHVWRPLVQLARQQQLTKLRLLDVATGAGDIPIALWKRARRAGLDLEITAIDKSPQALEFAAAAAARHGAEIRFETCDVLADELPADAYDAAVSSLFLHHLSNQQALELLRAMRRSARRLVVVNDLLRCTRGWLLAHLAARLFTTSDVVAVDAPLSVRAAFTLEEVRRLADEAQLDGAELTRRWPLRFLLSWQPLG